MINTTTNNNGNNDGLIEVYKGSYYSKQKKIRSKRVVVFDLDETLGSFVDLEILWNIILKYTSHGHIEFDDILDLYPEFIRYGILSIFKYLYRKKISGECHKIYLYTNNQSTKQWVQLLIRYFNGKFKGDLLLFDQIIYAFKINNVQVELNRTTNRKTHDDFIRCAILPSTTSICFIDDIMYKDMKKERIYYIKPKAYKHHLSTDAIIQRLFRSKQGMLLLHSESAKASFQTEFTEKCKHIGVYRMPNIIIESVIKHDIIVSQKLMYYLKEYFYITNKPAKTKKRRPMSYQFTRKRNNHVIFSACS